MKQIVMATGVAYPDPVITGNGPGVLGDKTFTFTTIVGQNRQTVSVWRDNIVVVHVDPNVKVKTHTHERIVLNSGATYCPAKVLDRGEYGDYGIEDFFQDEQLVFITHEGLFVTRKNNVIGLIEQRVSVSGAVTAQKIPKVQNQP